MSFSREIKKELTGLPATTGTLTALIRMNGILGITGGLTLSIRTEYSATAQYIYKALFDLYEVRGEIQVEQRKNLDKNRIYRVYIEENVNQILDELSLADALLLETGIPAFIKENELLQADYLRGVFMARGSIRGLEHSNYQINIDNTYQEHAEDLANLMQSFDFKAKISISKNRYVVYLSRAEEIADFLTIIGAMQARLRFEEVKIIREMRGLANRQSNFESANIRKTVNASQETIAAIKHLSTLDKLPNHLIEVAKVRVENPDASLAELGQEFDPPLSKSAVNHRLRKILELEREWRETENSLQE